MTEEIMICPKCRLEYRKGFVVCAHCQIPLIEKSKDNVQESPDDFAHKKRISCPASGESPDKKFGKYWWD